jgi:hypothetical protein
MRNNRTGASPGGQPVELLLAPLAHLEEPHPDERGEAEALSLVRAQLLELVALEALPPLLAALPAPVDRHERALGHPAVGRAFGALGGAVDRPQHPLGHLEPALEGAEREVALVLGLELEPLLDDVPRQREVLAA